MRLPPPAAAGGETLPSLEFEFRESLLELELERPGETCPALELIGGEVRGGGMSMTVGEPKDGGTDRSVSESRRLCPCVGRFVGWGLR